MTKRAHRIRQIVFAAGVSLGVLLLTSVAVYGYVRIRYADRIAPNVVVAGSNLGGKTPDEALEQLETAVDAVASTPITLVGEGVTAQLPLEELSVVYETDATVAAAFQVGRKANPFETVYQQFRLLTGDPVRLPVVVSYQKERVTSELDRLNTELGDPEEDAGLDLVKGKLVATDERAGTSIDHAEVIDHLEERLQTLAVDRAIPFALTRKIPAVRRADVERLAPTLTPLIAAAVTLTPPKGVGEPLTVQPDELVSWLTIVRRSAVTDESWVFSSVPASDSGGGVILAALNRATLEAYLKTVAKQLDQESVDAKLTITDGRVAVFQTSQPGRALDQAQALERIAGALVERAKSTAPASVVGDASAATPAPVSVELPVTTVQPTVTSDSVDSLGLKELIGRAETDFSGSPDNRVHNITTGTNYLKGRLLKPGEEFSTVKMLGAVDASTGYLPELVIKENKTIPEYGGGLCQVSTTLFRAVLNAGLPVTERKAHSYRVSYYERGIGPGLDATVYLPRPDFKFKNDTPGWILVQGFVKGKTVTFELYGTSDGRTSVIDGPHTVATQSAPPDIYNRDDSLPAGSKKQLEKRHDGATTTATYVVTRDGQEINRQVFNSKYKALPAIFVEGPPAPAPEPTPEPSSDQPVTEATP